MVLRGARVAVYTRHHGDAVSQDLEDSTYELDVSQLENDGGYRPGKKYNQRRDAFEQRREEQCPTAVDSALQRNCYAVVVEFDIFYATMKTKIIKEWQEPAKQSPDQDTRPATR
eukprot:Em0016g825a